MYIHVTRTFRAVLTDGDLAGIVVGVVLFLTCCLIFLIAACVVRLCASNRRPTPQPYIPNIISLRKWYGIGWMCVLVCIWWKWEFIATESYNIPLSVSVGILIVWYLWHPQLHLWYFNHVVLWFPYICSWKTNFKFWLEQAGLHCGVF